MRGKHSPDDPAPLKVDALRRGRCPRTWECRAVRPSATVRHYQRFQPDQEAPLNERAHSALSVPRTMTSNWSSRPSGYSRPTTPGADVSTPPRSTRSVSSPLVMLTRRWLSAWRLTNSRPPWAWSTNAAAGEDAVAPGISVLRQGAGAPSADLDHTSWSVPVTSTERPPETATAEGPVPGSTLPPSDLQPDQPVVALNRFVQTAPSVPTT